jgi:hypothetical protein
MGLSMSGCLTALAPATSFAALTTSASYATSSTISSPASATSSSLLYIITFVLAVLIMIEFIPSNGRVAPAAAAVANIVVTHQICSHSPVSFSAWLPLPTRLPTHTQASLATFSLVSPV